MSSSNAQPQTAVLVAETDDVRPFARLLRGIGLKQNAVMTLSEHVIDVTVEEVQTICASASIPASLFQTYTFHPPPPDESPCFEISLDSLLQCLNIFGNAGPAGYGSLPLAAQRSKRRWAGDGDLPQREDDEDDVSWRPRGKEKRTGMRMIWGGRGYPLEILLVDNDKGPKTRCELKTFEPETLMDSTFDESDLCLKLIMKSEWFRDALLDLPPSSERITLIATPRNDPEAEPEPGPTGSSDMRRAHRADVGNFTITAQGDFGTTELDYPNDKEVLDTFQCIELVQFSYHSSHINLLARALNQSVKICVRIASDGFLGVQVMMPMPQNLPVGQHYGMLEFKMFPLTSTYS